MGMNYDALTITQAPGLSVWKASANQPLEGSMAVSLRVGLL